MNNAFVTRQLTGLPGRPKNKVLPDRELSGRLKEAKVVGLPVLNK